MARRPHITLMLVVGVTFFLFLTYHMSGSSVERIPLGSASGSGGTKSKASLDLPDSVLTGGAIAPKLENATAK